MWNITSQLIFNLEKILTRFHDIINFSERLDVLHFECQKTFCHSVILQYDLTVNLVCLEIKKLKDNISEESDKFQKMLQINKNS